MASGLGLAVPGCGGLRADTSERFEIRRFWHPHDKDATPSIQRALAAAGSQGGGEVQAAPRRVYEVSAQTVFPALVPDGGVTEYPVCVQIPSGVSLNMNGSTLRLRGHHPAVIVANQNLSDAGARDHRIGIRDAVIDGRNVLAPDKALLQLAHIDELSLINVKIVRGNYLGGWVYGCRHSYLDLLDSDQFVGQPWSIGSPLGTGNQVYDSLLGRLRGRNVRKINYETLEGNSFDLVLTRCHIDSIQASRCAAGIKIQWPSSEVTIGTVRTQHCGDPAGNSGLKIQGVRNGAPVTDVHVSRVIASHQTGFGLLMDGSVNCSVRSFQGFGNNTNGNRGDVWIGGINDHVHEIVSTNSGGIGVVIRPYARNYQLDQVSVTNPGTDPRATSNSGVSIFGGSGSMGDVACIDTRRPSTMLRGVDVTSPQAQGRIHELTVRGASDVPFKSVASGFPPPRDVA